MKSKRLKKICALLITAVLGVSMLVGCGSSTSTSNEASQTLVYNLGEDPDTIDPTLNLGVGSSILIMNCFEGLMKLDENDKAIPGVAEKTEVSEDGLVYTFTLREDAKWSDGQPVTANDFKYSWLRALNKETAAEYAYQMFYIKNGEKFNNGEVSEEEVGIKVIDDRTLEVTLESPTSYFPELLSFATYMPLREDIISKEPDTWATKPETYISNGAFTLKEWNMAEDFILAKNEHFWDIEKVKLDILVMSMVTDNNTAYASLEAGEFDMIDSVPLSKIEQGKEDGYINIEPYLGTYYLGINVRENSTMPKEVEEFLSNKDVRHALSLAIDRKGIVEKVTKADEVPAYAIVPQGISNPDGSDFADKEYYDPNVANVEEAKKLLKKAGYGEGLKPIPAIELMYNTEGSHKDIMQVVQQNWAEIGVTVNLTNQEWKVFLDTRNQGAYQVSRQGWTGDYVDPMTFLDIFVSDSGNNDVGFNNVEYDKLVKSAKLESDLDKRAKMLRKAEDILMDEMPAIPLYFYTTVRAISPSVKGLKFSTLGYVSFENAYIEE